MSEKNSYGKTRTYIKYNLPDLPDCSIVTDAVLVLQQYEHDPGNGALNYIYAYDCGTNTWESSTITWNNQPMSKTDLSSYTVLDYQKYVGNTTSGSTVQAAAYQFNITKAAKNWYENGINNGIMLASADESITKRSRFCSSEYSSNSDFFPSVWVSYVNNTGVEDYWTYKTVDLGRSGAVCVSDYNGSLTYVHYDVSTNGNRMPASVSHVYSNDRTYFGGTYGNMKIGIGFRLNIMEQVEVIGSSTALYAADYRLKFIDGDGTVHYFKTTDTTNTYAHEFNEKLIIKKLSDGQYEMSDEEGNKKTFSAEGYLLEIVDSNSNSVRVSYSTENRITKVTDGANKEITFTYTGNYLTGITDHAGRTTTFNFAVNSNGEKTRYLRSIQYPDGKTTTFYYNSNAGGRMLQIIAHDASDVVFSVKDVVCKSKTFYRVETVTRRGSPVSGVKTAVNKLTFTYNNGETVVTDMYGKSNYIYFDNAGRTVNIRDHESNTSYAKYNSSGNKANTLALQSNTFAPINNLVKNNSAEFTDNGEWYSQMTSETSGTVEITTEQAYIGYKSFGITSAVASGSVDCCQAFLGVPGKTYTLSAYVKIPEALGNGSGGAALALTYKDANGEWQTVHGEYITVRQDWRRESFTFTLPSDATGDMCIMLSVFECEGTAYFDCIQLEENSTMNRYNLLDNSGFDYNNLHWGCSSSSSSDGIVTSGINGKGVRLYGSPSADKNIYQDIQVNGKSGDTVVYGAWAKANAAGQSNSNSSNTTFKATLTITYADGTKDMQVNCSTLM